MKSHNKSILEPIIPFIEGDGIGPDIWKPAQHVLDQAVKKAYQGTKKIIWKEILAGEKAFKQTGNWLPEETLDEIRRHEIAIKGPLTTPIGGGIRSINVTLRQVLDLYACIRPIRYFGGVPSPLKEPQKLNVMIFRENTEDVYAGIEWASGSPEAEKVRNFLVNEMKAKIRQGSGIGIKPMSPFASKRLVRMAFQYTKTHGRKVVTFVHKGNIMKFTEGAFRQWAYEVATEEFGDATVLESALKDLGGKVPPGKILVNDRIADAMFQMVLLRPEEYSVIVTPNLDGDYLSDACAAQVGGLGMAPGANIGDEAALFEATHGTAPSHAGKDEANPTSLILSGAMMLEHLGWEEAAKLVVQGIERTIEQKTVTYDLERQMSGAKKVGSSEFGENIVTNMG
ncbi:MAG: isocitrate dehydrogenase (NADP(+)) [Deltaproteobacteria bacterium RIFCSPLOWO2_01_44_7]|nr:MAG: isocitrate dehydrogenase (NADP(+)) [Deltaproteobacteria bacterium RIFCSPHIGHO2_01_FULL_43_49]OGQ14375.1 MAG: isocitrate dehydrogenase (NADP(+)) [Deltaproteobacteria bacterium RIFCSPHIGHO2_02_FULL_44_53]OGQ27585.1 MAG: isocitrate dehydrogenase (NADP(+)) [Deltaproteobacteria bacterium RIFCSPHIGHO2_12_FULL_44_21]OGQ30816.1 MAG: isocitrate dehydrogenase (NADP(+)) [Deltaproteobacteria bacterium RIFCSPLOWO2_01_FULL_45_74]OGQ40571.1 MAG: isocitrate dehydrogenase (NADP(+)) [Deltaproteobacteria 